jgi:acetyl esterase/lipase
VESIRYGPHPDQVVDLTFPDRSGAPLVCLLHGGYWRAAYDRTHLRVVADALTNQGYAVANLEYRRVGAGGGWPTTFEDVSAVLDLLPTVLATRFAGRVDVGSTTYVGHSAGGHLALWAATRPAASVRGVVALAPVADLSTAYSLGLSHGAVAELLGGSPGEVPERYAAADPMTLDAPRARTVLVHGDADDVAPPELSSAYSGRTGASLVILPGVGHFDLIDPGSTSWPAVLAAIDLVSGRETSETLPTVVP